MAGSVKPQLVREADIKVTIEAEIERLWEKRGKLAAKIARKEEMLHNVQELLSSDRLIASTAWMLEGERKEMKDGVERIRMQVSSIDRTILSLESEADCAEDPAGYRESECTASQRVERIELEEAKDGQDETMEASDETTDSRPKENEDVIFDVLLCHKQRILDEWDEPSDRWNMQAESWVEACSICRIHDGIWAEHDWRECTKYPPDVESVRRAYVGVVNNSGLWTRKDCKGFNGWCGQCGRGKIECWVESSKDACRLGGVVAESVAAILGTRTWYVNEWEAREGRERGGSWRERRCEGERYGFTEAGRVWRTFGWLGMWDITEIKVDVLKEAYHTHLRKLSQSREAQRRRELFTAARGGVDQAGRSSAAHVTLLA